MVHSKGIREPEATLLSTDLAVTSWKVTPANSGVETERTSPASGNSGTAAGAAADPLSAPCSPDAGLSACASHLIASIRRYVRMKVKTPRGVLRRAAVGERLPP